MMCDLKREASATTSLSANASDSGPMIKQRLQQSKDYNSMHPKKNFKRKIIARGATCKRLHRWTTKGRSPISRDGATAGNER